MARHYSPWRDNVEAVTMAVILAVLFKYFVVEAYKIPTGSMQPTLFGWEDTEGGGVYDRILVDKASYHWRDPERFEIVVFKFPLDRSKNFIKRVWGLPGDRIRIEGGDIWHRRSSTEDWTVLRRPRPVQRSTWRALDGAWSFGPTPDTWREDGDDLVATGAGSASFPKGVGSVRNLYTDGYPGRLGERVAAQRNLPGGDRHVGDLRIEVEVEAAPDCVEVRLVLREGTRRYTARIPGPAASEDARPSLAVSDSSHRIPAITREAARPTRLRTGRATRVAFQNLDDLVELEVASVPRLEVEVPSARNQQAGFLLETRGGGATFREIELYRDIFYTTAGSIRSEFEVPAGHYLMLGDNTLDSADSREWQLIGFRVNALPYDGSELRGSERRNENPLEVVGADGEVQTFFFDRFGERHHFPRGQASKLTPITSSFVPREMITGRALLVFWPFLPKLDVYRLRWIR